MFLFQHVFKERGSKAQELVLLGRETRREHKRSRATKIDRLAFGILEEVLVEVDLAMF
jgi:hypothetical protein